MCVHDNGLVSQLWPLLVPLSRWRSCSVCHALVAPLLELTRSSSSEAVLGMARDMYFDLLKIEHAKSGGFRRVEHNTIDAVDRTVAQMFRQGQDGARAICSDFDMCVKHI